MEAVIAQADLNKALKALKLTLPPLNKALIPATSGVHMKGNSSTGTVVATTFDTDSFTQVELPAQNVVDGHRVLPGKLFMDLVSKVGGDLEFTQDAQNPVNTVVKHPQATKPVRLTCIDPSMYPTLPTFNAASSFDISTDELKLLVARTAWAHKKGETDAQGLILAGVGISVKPDPSATAGILSFSCTNRVDAAYKSIPVTYASNLDLVIYAEQLTEVANIMPPGQTCSVSWDNAFVMFKAGPVTYFGRQLASRYPDLKGNLIKILNNSKSQFEVKRADLIEKLELVGIIVNGSGLHDNEGLFTFDQSGLTIFGERAEAGEITEQVTGALTGAAMSMNMKVPLILNALRAMDADEVIFELTGNQTPAVIHPKGSTDELFLALPVAK